MEFHLTKHQQSIAVRAERELLEAQTAAARAKMEAAARADWEKSLKTINALTFNGETVIFPDSVIDPARLKAAFEKMGFAPVCKRYVNPQQSKKAATMNTTHFERAIVLLQNSAIRKGQKIAREKTPYFLGLVSDNSPKTNYPYWNGGF